MVFDEMKIGALVDSLPAQQMSLVVALHQFVDQNLVTKTLEPHRVLWPNHLPCLREAAVEGVKVEIPTEPILMQDQLVAARQRVAQGFSTLESLSQSERLYCITEPTIDPRHYITGQPAEIGLLFSTRVEPDKPTIAQIWRGECGSLVVVQHIFGAPLITVYVASFTEKELGDDFIKKHLLAPTSAEPIVCGYRYTQVVSPPTELNLCELLGQHLRSSSYAGAARDETDPTKISYHRIGRGALDEVRESGWWQLIPVIV